MMLRSLAWLGAALVAFTAAESSEDGANFTAEVIRDDKESEGKDPQSSGMTIERLQAIREVVKGIERLEHEESTCGVNAVFKEHRWVPSPRIRPQCHRMTSLNCSVSYHQIECPEECPFIAPDQHFPCQFACRQDHACAVGNADLAWPDARYNLCRRCPITGCAWCKSRKLCAKCWPGFILTDEGSCIFGVTRYGVSAIVLNVLIVLIVLILISSCFHTYFYGGSQMQRRNMLSILAAREHRHFSKVHMWDLSSAVHPRTRHNLMVDLSSENIIGMGLGLFYNSICFTLVVGLIAAACTYYIQLGTVIETVIVDQYPMSFPDEQDNVDDIGVMTRPALISSVLEHCRKRSPFQLEDLANNFASFSSHALSTLYLTLFAVSLWFVGHQKRWADRFDAVNNSMKDFVVLLEGLPASANDEVELKRWACETMKKSTDIADVEIEGVSICYNYSGFEDKIQAMLERQSTYIELSLYQEVQESDYEDMEKVMKEYLEGHMKDDRKEAAGWFEGAGSFKCTGHAFLVFKSSDSKDRVLSAAGKQPSLFVHPADKTKNVKVVDVKSEPPDVFWENIKMSDDELRVNTWKAVLKVALIFLVVQAVVVWPFNLLVVIPYLSAGASAGGPVTMVNGIIMAIVNAQLGGQVLGAAFGIGFHRKDRADVFLFGMNVFITICNTFTTLLLMVVAVFISDKTNIRHHESYLDPVDIRHVGEENQIAKSVYLMLVPGQFFVNCVNGLLMGGMVPWIQHSFVSKVIYVWRAMPDFLLNILQAILPWASGIDKYQRFNAEKTLEAPQIGLPWDYSNLIVNVSVVFSIFFFVSPHCFQLCMYLALWAAFYWVWCRFMHLRVQSVSYSSTDRLDWWVLMAWGLPLSELASCAVAWYMRAGHLMVDQAPYEKWLVVGAVFVLSWSLWVCAVLLVHPIKHESPHSPSVSQFKDTKSRWIFTWFNCNPVYAVKCLHYIQTPDGKTPATWDNPLACGENGDEVRYYRTGKEHLHFSKDKQKKIRAKLHDWLEFETYLEWVLRIWDLCAKKGGKLQRSDFYMPVDRDEAISG